MKKIIQISFPRSRTRLLQFLLLAYFSKDPFFPGHSVEEKKYLVYEFTKARQSLEVILKRYLGDTNNYRVLNSDPIIVFSHLHYDNNETNYMYCHDHPDNPEEILNNCELCILQNRHPVFANLSHIEYDLDTSRMKQLVDGFANWKSFYNKWKDFLNHKKVYYITYRSLIKSPRMHVANILSRLGYQLDPLLLETIINIHDIKSQNDDLTDKVFANSDHKKMLNFLEAALDDELNDLNMERVCG